MDKIIKQIYQGIVDGQQDVVAAGSRLLTKKHYGFNFQWMCAWRPDQAPEPADEKALDFLAELGFNFVRIPLDYRLRI
jgi:hypothetical protein